jgi:hypothetical protein
MMKYEYYQVKSHVSVMPVRSVSKRLRDCFHFQYQGLTGHIQ